MKISTTNFNYVRIGLILMTVAFCLFYPENSFAQSLSEFEDKVESETTSFKNIAKNIIDIVLILGAIGVIYAYVTKRQDAKDYLIYYLIGLIILGVLRQSVLA